MTRTLQTKNPATLELLAELPIADAPQVKKAVREARLAAPAWQALSFSDRARYVLRFRDLIRLHQDQIAELITLDNGKPLIESIVADIFPVLELSTYFAKNTEKILKKERIWLGKWSLLGRSSSVNYMPLGVIGIISPWNYPFSIPAGQVMMALMAGNTVILKPSEYTPLVGQKIGELCDEAGFPKGVIQVLIGDGLTGAALVNSDLDKIFFTGSVLTGKKIMAAARHRLKW